MMKLDELFWSVAAGAIVSLTSTAAWAGCNCGVPPSPTGVAVTPVQWNQPGQPAMFPGGYMGSPGGYMGSPGGYMGSPGGYMGSAYGAVEPGGLYSVGQMPLPAGSYSANGPHWAPGGYEARVGSPAYYHDPSGGQYVVSGNPYTDHFGPGFQRNSLHGHYRFPYYNYRAPWYYPGRAVYNRNTNFAW